jgi:uncharacterized membrane protein YhaH (DUF805 family)
MLDAVFSFRGRIGRLQYVLGSLALSAGIVLPAALIFAALKARDAASEAGALGVVGLVLIVLVPLFAWIATSLQARRLRDIGFNPLYAVPIILAFNVADRLAAMAVPGLSFAGLHQQTPLGLLVNLATAGALLFWPGRTDGGGASVRAAGWMSLDDLSPAAPEDAVEDAAALREPEPVRAPAPSPIRRAPPVRAVNAAGVTFGRRGL